MLIENLALLEQATLILTIEKQKYDVSFTGKG
jgi:hypothetical protein